MTEGQWLAGTDPKPMLEHLRRQASDRKLRLFAVACCRHVWQLLIDERSRRAVEAAERFADGAVSNEEFEVARFAGRNCRPPGARHAPEHLAALAAAEAAVVCCWADYVIPEEEVAYGAAWGSADWCSRALGHDACGAARARVEAAGAAAARAEGSAQCNFLRDVFGNPFRPRPAVAPEWLAWEGGTVKKLAGAFYQERAFDRLPILGDALEEAGCTNPELLSHLRGPEPHVRGCWAVDLILGRE